MTPSCVSARYTLLIAGLLAISIPADAHTGTVLHSIGPAAKSAVEALKEALSADALDSASHADDARGRIDEPAIRDPHFTPTAAKATSYMPRVIIRNIREDRAGNVWFATFGGPIRYDG